MLGEIGAGVSNRNMGRFIEEFQAAKTGIVPEASLLIAVSKLLADGLEGGVGREGGIGFDAIAGRLDLGVDAESVLIEIPIVEAEDDLLYRIKHEVLLPRP